MSEQVIKRDEYKVGMKVRLRNGETQNIVAIDEPDIDEYCMQSERYMFSVKGERFGGNNEYDIIGEVVANAAAPEVATPKRADFMTYEKRVYSDDMFVANGMVDSMSMAELVEQRRYYDRAISRLKATAKHYGWEV